jgi:branched-subunit amino acid transport protein
VKGQGRAGWFFRVWLPFAAAVSLVTLVLDHVFGSPGTTHWSPAQLILASVVAACGVMAIAVMALYARRNRPRN